MLVFRKILRTYLMDDNENDESRFVWQRYNIINLVDHTKNYYFQNREEPVKSLEKLYTFEDKHNRTYLLILTKSTFQDTTS